MAQERVQRRLAAILAADVVGYSRLVGKDEEGTLARLKALRDELIDPSIARHGGRIVKTMGDGVLVEFPSVVDAVRSAVEVQKAMAERNIDVPEDRRIELRVGVNLGDIVIDGDDILGDGVNIAARLEGLAEAGGICIPRKVFHEVRNKLDVGYAFIGEQKVKNIETPIPVYRVLLAPEAAGQVIGEARPGRPRWQLGAVAAAILALVAVGGAWWWQAQQPDFEPADPAKMAYALPEKPSIAVLPFDNLSGDPEQAYFADGLTEDIITNLAGFPNLFVIARNSTNKYKGKAVDIRDVAHDLGVRYVLEGSVRRSGNTVRITAQLIDALSGSHIWAKSYDRELGDVFALQDEITSEIGSRLVSKVASVEWQRRSRKGTRNAEAYDLFLRGRKAIADFNPRANARAIQLIEQAIEKDPEYARAYAFLGFARRNNALMRWSKGPKDTFKHAVELTQKAVALDPRDSETHRNLGRVYHSMGQYDRAIDAVEKSIALSPSNPEGLITLAYTLAFAGRGVDAVKQAETAIRLNPHGPWFYSYYAGFAYYSAEQFEKAAASFDRARRLNPRTPFPLLWSAAAYAQLGELEKAIAAREAFMKLRPGYSVQVSMRRNKMKGEFRTLYLEGLRKAGLPENPPLKLPDKPSIAVLPFTNMSGDAEQEYFADGMTEDIITDLSKISGLFVIARNSTFQYKGKSPDLREVGRDLGVRYVLEGSVRRAGDQVRINAQLVDAANGGHLWAERYDGELKDVFTLQDKVTRQIVAALAVKLTPTEQQQAAIQETNSPKAYDAFLQGWEHYRRNTPEDFAKAVRFLETAIGLDPDYGRAHAALANVYWLAWRRGAKWSEALAPTHMMLYGQTDKYLDLAMKRPTPLAHQVASRMHSSEHRHEDAIAEAERAVALDPNDADSYAALALASTWAGKAEVAVRHIERAMRLDPHYPSSYLYVLGLAKFGMGQLDAATALMERAFKRNPEWEGPQTLLIALYGLMGRESDAQPVLKTKAKYRERSVRILKLRVRFYLNRYPFWDPRVAERFGTGLVKAGICCQEQVGQYLEYLRELRSPE